MRSARRTVLRLAAIGLCVAAAGCARPAPPQPAGGSTSNKAEKARKDAELLVLGGVKGGATAHVKADPGASVRHEVPFNIALLPGKTGSAMKGTAGAGPKGAPAPPPPPVAPVEPDPAPVATGPTSTPRPGWIIRERVKSTIPYATVAEAEEDAVATAREVIERRLGELDPPLRRKPSAGEVRAEFLRKDSRVVRPPDATERETFARYGVTGNLVYVEYDVEVTADQVRELRSQERVSAGLRVMGVLAAVALAGFLFLRADEWTRGYLTSWLALGAVALAAGAAAALILV